ncbi:phosphomannomutase [Alkalimonas sp. NCh-2]|uniref:phosphomannomutase n=1 Tax=Alkalimonas sp. NCh-2 TaxID=3144846 RepID=UPI0031F66AA4
MGRLSRVVQLSCFKRYDIRGDTTTALTPVIAYAIAKALVEQLGSTAVAVGCDARLSSPALKDAVIAGLVAAGARVLDLGLVATEQLYFVSQQQQLDGVMITGSHNPAHENGMKLVSAGAVPLDPVLCLPAIKQRAESYLEQGGNEIRHVGAALPPSREQPVTLLAPSLTHSRYLQHLIGLLGLQLQQQRTVVVNCGHGVAGPLMQQLAAEATAAGWPLQLVLLHAEPDGRFPTGVPNPLLSWQRQQTADAVLAHQADLGIAFDGDADRCFFFDHRGHFIDSYYLISLFSQWCLPAEGGKVVLEQRACLGPEQGVLAAGGEPVFSRAGHVFIKQCMREHDAVYAGENSGHHYFKALGFCDSGVFPLLLVLQQLEQQALSLAAMLAPWQAHYLVSDEINYHCEQVPALLQYLKTRFQAQALSLSEQDGLSIGCDNWRFNLRQSTTEPMLRLNVEVRGDAALLAAKLAMVQHAMAQGCPAIRLLSF